MDSKIISTQITSLLAAGQQQTNNQRPTDATNEPNRATGQGDSGTNNVEQNKSTEPLEPQTAEQVDELVDKLNAQALTSNHTLRFSIDEKLGKAIISVVDRDTDEVIRQIPPETALQIAEAFEEVSAGNLLTESA